MIQKRAGELVSNKRAFHNFEILETIEAGIALLGTEIKSLRNHGGALQDAYIEIRKGEAYLISASIAPYRFATVFTHEERRKRKLLLHKNEIARLKRGVEQKGVTLIPLSLYLKKGHVKVKIAVAKGKKLYDKRAAIKEREHKRAIDRELKDRS